MIPDLVGQGDYLTLSLISVRIASFESLHLILAYLFVALGDRIKRESADIITIVMSYDRLNASCFVACFLMPLVHPIYY